MSPPLPCRCRSAPFLPTAMAAATTTKRTIEHVVDPEQNEKAVSRKLGTVAEVSHAPSQPFVRIAFPHAAPQKVPALQYPNQLTTFSYTADHELEFTNSAMRYYCEAPLNSDLSYRYENWIKKSESRGRLDGLLRACLRDEVSAERRRTAIITWRGVMTKCVVGLRLCAYFGTKLLLEF